MDTKESARCLPAFLSASEVIKLLGEQCPHSFARACVRPGLLEQSFAAYAIARNEIKRCFRIWVQAFVSPSVTRLLFFFIFRLIHLTALPTRSAGPSLHSALSYEEFLIPGLIFSALMQEACGNTVYSLFPAKYHGVLEAVLVAPASFVGLILGYVAGGCLRACVVSGLLALGLKSLGYFLAPLHFFKIVLLALQFSIIGSLMGIAMALLVRSFDQIALINQIVMTILFCFSGTLFPLERCPPIFLKFAAYNPFFYFNKAFFGAWTGEGEPLMFYVAMMVGFFAIISLLWFNARLLKNGHGLRS